MTTRTESAGIYGLINGLGFPGDQRTKTRLIQSAQRAASRSDWETLAKMGVAYLIGSAIGASLRGRR